jgi:hypothetical protein
MRLFFFIGICMMFLCLGLFTFQACAPSGQVQVEPFAPDTLMGDWLGKRVLEDGREEPLVAQVIAYDSGRYTINLLDKFDSRDPAIAVLEGKKRGNAVNVRGEGPAGLFWQGRILGRTFEGTFSGNNKGSFSLTKIVRLSPTLGEEPPAGAQILFEGSSLDLWMHPPQPAGYVNLARIFGTNDCVAYLRTELWSDAEQEAVFLLGSDDGVKLWLNGQISYLNNTLRGAEADDDTFKVRLNAGWNELVLKVTNGSGGWGVFARLQDDQGQALTSIAEKDYLSDPTVKTRNYLDANQQFLTLWQVAGPYKKDNLGPEELFHLTFAPEVSGMEVNWQLVEMHDIDYSASWNIRNGAMEVNPGSGSLMTRQQFNDFQLHLEFRTPFMPYAKGQARGNSGVYIQGRYEIQVLDSYGLEGKDNECGGIYKVAVPRVNMCAPPAQWQTYDIDFRAARFDARGNKVSNAFITVLHNGVAIHDNLEIPMATAGGLDTDMSKPGPILLQDHGDLVQFRNIWLVEN